MATRTRRVVCIVTGLIGAAFAGVGGIGALCGTMLSDVRLEVRYGFTQLSIAGLVLLFLAVLISEPLRDAEERARLDTERAMANGYRAALETALQEHDDAMRRLRRSTPPDGWFTFGSHIHFAGKLEFSRETDGGGMPLWERPLPLTEDAAPQGDST